MKKWYFGIMAIIVICSLCACNNTVEEAQVASGGSIRLQQAEKDGVAINMPDESTVSGRLSPASEKYVYSIDEWSWGDDLCIYQYDYDGNRIKKFKAGMKMGESDDILYVGKDEIIYLQTPDDYFGEGENVIWSIPLKNVGKKSEKPDYKNMKKIMILEAGENMNVFCFHASEKLLAGFFAGEYKEIDRSSGKERKISQNEKQKYYNFSYPFILNNVEDGEICNSLGSDLIEDGYVLLTTDYTESKGTLYLHKIGTSIMEKVAEDVYPAQRLISGNGKFFYWGITSMPRDSETIFDGIWMFDIKTGQQKQLVSKGELQKMTKVTSAGEMFLDANGRLYFEVSKEDLCCCNREFFSLSPDAPNDLQKEEKMTEKLANCQYIKTYFGDTLYFEDGDGEYEEDIYTYDLKSGKIKKLKNWCPFAEVGYIC